MTTTPSGNGFGKWLAGAGVAVGLLYLVIYLLGGVPGMPSPFIRQPLNQAEDHRMVQERLDKHIATTESLLRVSRQTCRGIWRSDPAAQKGCED